MLYYRDIVDVVVIPCVMEYGYQTMLGRVREYYQQLLQSSTSDN